MVQVLVHPNPALPQFVQPGLALGLVRLCGPDGDLQLLDLVVEAGGVRPGLVVGLLLEPGSLVVLTGLDPLPESPDGPDGLVELAGRGPGLVVEAVAAVVLAGGDGADRVALHRLEGVLDVVPQARVGLQVAAVVVLPAAARAQCQCGSAGSRWLTW